MNALVNKNFGYFFFIMSTLVASWTHSTLVTVQANFSIAVLNRLMIDWLMLENGKTYCECE